MVEAHLNKRYVAAVVYEPGPAWRTLADLHKTVLKHAWQQNELIARKLAQVGIALQPLMLVQVANGEGAVAQARDYLIRDCHVPPDVIGSYEGKDNDPGALQAIARNPVFQVLIFKEAAGTGFDAPRAFILTSTKAVADMDFAAQFIGRIMRVKPCEMRPICCCGLADIRSRSNSTPRSLPGWKRWRRRRFPK